MPQLFKRLARITVGANVSLNGSDTAGIRVEKHRCSFKVEKTLKPQPNSCELKIWNLSAAQRSQIEELNPKTKDLRGIPVLIEAGYEATDAHQIFLGDLRTSYSEKSGPDWITTVESGDGEKAKGTARIQVSFGPKTAAETVLRAIVKELGVGAGNLNSAVSKLKSKGVASLYQHGVTISGSASVALTNFCNSAEFDWSIQDGALQFIDKGKALAAKSVRLSPRSGLIESPSVDPKGIVTAKALIIPEIKCGRVVVIESFSVNGSYLVQKASWEGDNFSGPWYATIEGKRY